MTKYLFALLCAFLLVQSNNAMAQDAEEENNDTLEICEDYYGNQVECEEQEGQQEETYGEPDDSYGSEEENNY